MHGHAAEAIDRLSGAARDILKYTIRFNLPLFTDDAGVDVGRPANHPRQLWAFNPGRIACAVGKTDTAAAWFRNSLSICLSARFGSTVHAMALLPLSGLIHLGRLEHVDVAGAEKTVRNAAKALNPKHYGILNSRSFHRVRGPRKPCFRLRIDSGNPSDMPV